MQTTIRRFILLSAFVFGGALTACGGCDDTAAGAGLPDGSDCVADDECAGTCGADDVCEGGGTTDNNGTNSNNNGGTTGTNNGGTTGANNGGTTGAPDGSECTADTDCNGTCNSDGVCVGGGLPDGSMCVADEECQGFCETGVCAGAGDGGFDMNGSGQVLCGSEPCECDDGIDNDGDGLTDGLDPECTGPYDDDEGSFATGIPGDNKDPKWQDCFFDGNSGAGDDGCRYHTDCLTGDLPQDDPDCSISQECFDFCRPLTPNGCDCFGCCGVNTDEGVQYVQIGSDGCDTDDLDACATCIPTTECLNDCGDCELCYGKTVADLPAVCSDGPGLTGDPCTSDADCQGICGGNNTCEGFGGGGFDGDSCMDSLDCRGICGGDNTCEGFGDGSGFDGDSCMTDVDCRGTCGGDNVCTGSGGSDGFDGDACASDTDCRGVCGGDNTCDGYGSGGYNGDGCQTDADCRGVCGGNNTCESSGSGSGSGVQCSDGEPVCPNGQSDCASDYYCQQGCCIFIPG